MFMDSFTNSIFNRSSIFGAVGTSLVKGIKVSGISFQDNNGTTNDQVTVDLSTDPSSVNISNNNSASVTIIATRIPFNIQNLISLGALSSQNGNPLGGNTGVRPPEGGIISPLLGGEGSDASAGNLYQGVNPFEFLSLLIFVSVIPFTGESNLS